MSITSISAVHRKKKMRGIKYLLIALPFMVFVFLMSYVPLFGWIYSLFDYKPGLPLSSLHFVGLANFQRMFTQYKEILRVLRNTLALSGLNLILSPLPIVFAIMLNELTSSKVRRFVQTTTTLPNFISWIVVYGFAFAIFSNNGLINMVLRSMGMQGSTTGIIGDVNSAWAFQTFLMAWKSLGWSAIIYLAAILGIDQEQYEAAKIDGANRVRCIWHITVPGVLPTYFVLLLLSISNVLSNGFDQFFVFTNPMVSSRIEVLDYYVYKIGIIFNQYSYSIAIGITKSLISLALLFIANFASKKIRGHSIF